MPTCNDAPIAVIGLGYVGLPLAVEFGKQRKVVGFDINAARIAELRAGEDNTLEVDAVELGQAKYLTFTDDLTDLADCSIFILTVPTPIDEHKRPDLTPLLKASEIIGKVLKRGDIVIGAGVQSGLFCGLFARTDQPRGQDPSAAEHRQGHFRVDA